MKKKIAVLPGDGVGPEVVAEAVKVLKKVAAVFGHEFELTEELIGAVAIEKTGDPYPIQTHELCLNSDAILLGAIGDPKYDNDPAAKVRPEQGLLEMRKKLALYTNIRPVSVFNKLLKKSPLKNNVIKGADFIVVRELTGGIYFGKRGRTEEGAFDTSVYSKKEILRVAEFAYPLSRKRKKKVTMVDKANVLETSRLWRETIQEYSKLYPDIKTEYMFVDNAAQQIIKNPTQFDVILTENMFGDILTDEAAVIVGSLGMLPSASIGEKIMLFEPIHGSYPKARGLNTANPIATILSVAMLLIVGLNLDDEGKAVHKAVETVINQGIGTKDIFPENPSSTSQVGDAVAHAIS